METKRRVPILLAKPPDTPKLKWYNSENWEKLTLLWQANSSHFVLNLVFIVAFFTGNELTKFMTPFMVIIYIIVVTYMYLRKKDKYSAEITSKGVKISVGDVTENPETIKDEKEDV